MAIDAVAAHRGWAARIAPAKLPAIFATAASVRPLFDRPFAKLDR